MALGTGYDQQWCHLARTLEVVGERWTMLILRDCFYGVRRFSDLRDHLDISRAVLAKRIDTLVEAQVLTRDTAGGHPTYSLTEAGKALWPAIFALSKWGERYADAAHAARVFSHAQCGKDVDEAGQCRQCGVAPPPEDLVVRPGEGPHTEARQDPVSLALREPHRMLTPIVPIQA